MPSRERDTLSSASPAGLLTSLASEPTINLELDRRHPEQRLDAADARGLHRPSDQIGVPQMLYAGGIRFRLHLRRMLVCTDSDD